jgi:NAD(P)-dependent dehydrogenase (short-subunit alcohol dehydrogenase family)
MRLPDKVVLLAGFGPVFGRATAILFAQEGATVALAARSEQETERVAEHIRTVGGRAVTFQADVTVPDQARGVVDATLEAFGRLDVLLNVAGDFWWRVSEFGDMELEYFEQVLRNNLRGILLCSQRAIPALERSGAGVIVNFGAASKVRLDGSTVYSAAKLGVLGLTQAMARELQPRNIRVNCLCPGFMRDPATLGPIIPAPTRLARRGRGEDVAYAALYLASDESGWVTGQSLVVDGGDDVLAKSPYEQW